jgi:dimethylargininase
MPGMSAGLAPRPGRRRYAVGMLVAITRGVSDGLGACELTHLTRTPIDIGLAREQHRGYEDALRRSGCRVVSLPPLHDLPDAVFLEDVALVLDELAIVTRPGAQSRRPETASIAAALKTYRTVVQIEAPGTLDGGDVLRLGRRIFVGLSERSNSAAVEQLRRLVEPHGYSVTGVAVTGCLHLKSAVTEVAPNTILVNSAWVDPRVFGDVEAVEIDSSEPYAANGLRVGSWHPASAGRLIYPASFPRTRRILEARGILLDLVDVSELQKAEGAVTCCSLLCSVDPV